MDERGLTVDPNRDPLEPVRWWEEIGATLKPSPYRTSSWVYIQEHDKESVVLPVPGSDPLIGQGATQIFATVYVYDRKASNPDPEADQETLDTKGTLLGQLSYEILGSVMTITDWSHHNWHDATPVRQAFKALMYNTPDCVMTVIVDKPEAFWKSLGFIHPSKDSDVLVLNNPKSNPVPY